MAEQRRALRIRTTCQRRLDAARMAQAVEVVSARGERAVLGQICDQLGQLLAQSVLGIARASAVIDKGEDSH